MRYPRSRGYCLPRCRRPRRSVAPRKPPGRRAVSSLTRLLPSQALFVEQGQEATRRLLKATLPESRLSTSCAFRSSLCFDASVSYSAARRCRARRACGASSRTRHFERATVLIKYAVLQLIVTVHLISTKFMCADIFTKATDEQTFKTMRSVMRNEPSPDGYAIRAARWINTLMRVSSPV